MKEIVLNEMNGITVEPGKIQFPEYHRLKKEAQQLADYLETVEVTEETVKANKKLLAAVNKAVKKLEDERISIKKQMLTPYDRFESEVKEIVETVKNADTIVRAQVRTMEERAREEKRLVIIELFNKRIGAYDFRNLFTAEDFIEPQHLNKSVSMNQIEAEMVEWMARIERETEVIRSLPHPDEVLTEFRDTKDLALAAQKVEERYKKLEMTQKAIQPEPSARPFYCYKLFNPKDAKLIEMFMKENEIKYEKETL